jgi:hypothetical protein
MRRNPASHKNLTANVTRDSSGRAIFMVFDKLRLFLMISGVKIKKVQKGAKKNKDTPQKTELKIRRRQG